MSISKSYPAVSSAVTEVAAAVSATKRSRSRPGVADRTSPTRRTGAIELSVNTPHRSRDPPIA